MRNPWHSLCNINTWAGEGRWIKLAMTLTSWPPLVVNFLVHTLLPLWHDSIHQFFTWPTGNGYKGVFHKSLVLICIYIYMCMYLIKMVFFLLFLITALIEERKIERERQFNKKQNNISRLWYIFCQISYLQGCSEFIMFTNLWLLQQL